MGEDRGALGSAAAALAARDIALADADRVLADLVRDAHAMATESIRRIDTVRAAIDAAVAECQIRDSASGRDFARFLIDKNRELHAIIAEAAVAAAAKTVALQELTAVYRGELPG